MLSATSHLPTIAFFTVIELAQQRESAVRRGSHTQPRYNALRQQKRAAAQQPRISFTTSFPDWGTFNLLSGLRETLRLGRPPSLERQSMTLESICSASTHFPHEVEDTPTVSLNAYQDYVRALCSRHPSLSALSSFLTDPHARTSGCRAISLEFRSGAACADIRSIKHISRLRSEFERATKTNMEKPCDDHHQQIQGRILIIEDLTVEVVALLGTELAIDPLFLATHLHTVHRTGLRHQTPDDANLPSRLHQSDYINIAYHQSVTCNDVFPAGARFMTDTAINRKLVFLRATNIGLAQHRVSVVKLRQGDGFWLGKFVLSIL